MNTKGKPRLTARDSRGSARERGYDTAWDRASRGYRAHHPQCLGCRAVGRAEPATVVDHIEPHRGSEALFWDHANWQPSCDWHHNVVKKALEARWDDGLIGKDQLRLNSPEAIRLTKRTPRKAAQIGVDGWPQP